MGRYLNIEGDRNKKKREAKIKYYKINRIKNLMKYKSNNNNNKNKNTEKKLLVRV